MNQESTQVAEFTHLPEYVRFLLPYLQSSQLTISMLGEDERQCATDSHNLLTDKEVSLLNTDSIQVFLSQLSEAKVTLADMERITWVLSENQPDAILSIWTSIKRIFLRFLLVFTQDTPIVLSIVADLEMVGEKVNRLALELCREGSMSKQIRTNEEDKQNRILAALNKQSAYLRALLDHVSEAIIACDEHCRLFFFNKAARILHGIPENVLSHPSEWATHYRLFYQDGTTLFRTDDIPLVRAYRGESVNDVLMVLALANAKRKVILASGTQIISNDGKLLGAMVMLKDRTDIKETEEKVAYREAQLLEAQTLASVGSFDWDLLTHTVTGTPQLYHILGLQQHEKPFHPEEFANAIHREDLEKVNRELVNATKGLKQFELEYRIVHPDGNQRIVYAKGKTIFNEDGIPIREIGTIMDITDRKISEDKLKESQRFLQHLADTTPDAIYILDRHKDRIVYANQGMVRALGYPQEEIINNYSAFFSTIIHANDRDRRLEYDQNLAYAKDDEVREIECQLKHADGQWRWFLLRSRVFKRTKDGTPFQILGIAQDITERKKAESDLKKLNEDLEKRVRVRTLQMEESIERFRSLLEAMPQMAWAVLHDGSFEYFNKQWFDYTGQTPEHAKKEGWQSDLHPDDQAAAKASWEHSLRTKQSYEVEYRFRRVSDGSYRWHLVRAEPVRNKKGKVNLWVGTCTDIHDLRVAIQNMGHTQEELKNTNEELSEKNEELARINVDLDNFMYSASHDLRSPVSNLEGLLALLTSELDGRLNTTEIAFIEMINTSLVKLKQTINDLTEITKVQKELNEEVEPLDFEQSLEDVKADIENLIEESNAEIITDFQVPIIHFTRKNLRSLFYNLVSNAIKYRSMDRLPQVRITTEQHEDYLLLIVSDNGLGIRSDQIDKIFLMFKRAHTHVEGTGVGLYIVKRIIENTGGRIEVKSELGEGTTFYVYFKTKIQQL